MRSNIFANIENKFAFASEEEIIETALSSMGELIGELSSFDDKIKFYIVILGAKLGVAGDGKINDKEKMLIDTVLDQIWNGDKEEIYKLVGEALEDSDYGFVENLIQLGNSVAMPLLYYILSFAYIDGVFEDDVAEKLDSLFGMTLMMDFFDSDMEEIPTQKNKLTGFEAEIVAWFQSDDRLRSLKKIQTHFFNNFKTY